MICLILCSMVLNANAFEDVFDRGNAAYDSGQYEQAITAYQELTASSVQNPMVYFNLGNAFYRLDRIGDAILNYERALLIEPTLVEAQDNLLLTVRKTKRRLSRPSPASWRARFFFWADAMNLGTCCRVALLCWTLAWSGLGCFVYYRKEYMRVLAVVLLMAGLLFSAASWHRAHPPLLAVTLVDEAKVRYGRNTQDTVRFVLYEGDRVRVDAVTDGWVRVETGEGERGWVRRDAVGLVSPLFQGAP